MSTINRVAVVGAASGIGASLVESYLDQGTEVLAIDVRKPSDSRAVYIECDLRDPASIAAAVNELPTGLSAIDYVAGVPGTHPDADVLAVNFLGMREFVNSALPKVASGGAITVVASTAGAAWLHRLADNGPLLATGSIEDGLRWLAENSSDYPAYSISKEASIAFIKSASGAAFKERQVRLNTVSPGPVETPILVDFERSMGKELLDGVRAMVGRHANTADIVPVIQAMSSPAFGWVVGQDIQVDGGLTAGFTVGSLTLDL